MDSDTAQANITRFWNLVAPHYEARPGNTAAPGSTAYQLWSDLIARVLPAAPADVLDVGTGTGFVALQAAALGHRVVGIDLASEMLAVGRAQGAVRGLNVRFEEADAIQPPFGTDSFDAVTCRHLLWTLRNATAALSNWRSILRRGGRLVIIDGLREPRPSHNVDPDDVFGHHYGPEVRAALPFFGMQREEPILMALAKAGFRDVDLALLDQQYVEGADEPVRPYVVVACVR